MFCLGKDMGYDVLFPRRSSSRQRVLKRCMADKLEKLKEHNFRWAWLVSESYISHATGTVAQSQRPYLLSGDATLTCNNSQGHGTPSVQKIVMANEGELYERFWDLEEVKRFVQSWSTTRGIDVSAILFTNSSARVGPNS
jgi:hypothetical protein